MMNMVMLLRGNARLGTCGKHALYYLFHLIFTPPFDSQKGHAQVGIQKIKIYNTDKILELNNKNNIKLPKNKTHLKFESPIKIFGF